MNKSVNLPSPRFETGRLMLIAGLQQHHTQQSSVAGIPAQWTKFMTSVEKISDRVGNTTYGIDVVHGLPLRR